MAEGQRCKVSVAGLVLPGRNRKNTDAAASTANKHPSDTLFELIADLLDDAGLAREARLGIFVGDEIGVSEWQRALEERFRPVLVEPALGRGDIGSLIRAFRSIATGECECAVVVGADRGHGVETAVFLAASQVTTSRTYAHVQGVAFGEAGTEQKLLLDACLVAGADPRSISLIDIVGAREDLDLPNRLAEVLSRGAGRLPHCTIGPNLGLQSPTAVESLCEAALAVYQRLLPRLPAECSSRMVRPFCGHNTMRPWIDTAVRRAAILACGPGGHAGVLLLQEPPRPIDGVLPRIAGDWPYELLLLSAASCGDLVDQMRNLIASLESRPAGGWNSIVQSASANNHSGKPCRAAVVARDANAAIERIRLLVGKLESGPVPSFKTPNGVYYNERVTRAPTVVLMPGQGSQYLGMIADLCVFVPEAQGWLERLQQTCSELDPCPPSLIACPPAFGLTEGDRRGLDKRLYQISGGAMVSLAVSLCFHSLLRKTGVAIDAMAGYSNGENAALIASGTWRVTKDGDLFQTIAAIRQSEAFEDPEVPAPRGVSVGVNRAARQLLEAVLSQFEGEAYLSLDNCPDNVTLFGTPDAIAAITQRLKDDGAVCIPLPFDRGHHTPFYNLQASALQGLYAGFDFGPGEVTLYSCAAAAPFPRDAAGIRELAASQWTSRVRFRETVERLYDDGIRTFIEAGPGGMLTAFVHATLRGRSHTAQAANMQGRPALETFLKLLGNLFVEGHDVHPEALRAPALSPVGSLRRSEATATPTVEVSDGALRASVMNLHAGLMHRFLECQHRSQVLVACALASAPAPKIVHRARSVPMLGSDIQTWPERLVARRTFDIATDGFLLQHVFGGRRADCEGDKSGLPVAPFTFSMELIAEAGSCLLGEIPRLRLRGIRALRWLAADEDRITVEVEARASKGGVFARISEVAGSLHLAAFEGLVSADPGPLPAVMPSLRRRRELRVSAAEFNRQLFHGPLLKSIQNIFAIEGDRVDILAAVPPVEGLFSETNPEMRIPAALLDGAGQLVACWLVEQGHALLGVFPFEVADYRQFGPPPAAGVMVWLRGSVRLNGSMTDATVDLVDAEGALIARLEGFRSIIYRPSDPYLKYLLGDSRLAQLANTAEHGGGRRLSVPAPGSEFCGSGGIWVRLLARRTLSRNERDEFARLGDEDRPTWVASRVLAKLAVAAAENWGDVDLTDLEVWRCGDAYLVRRTARRHEAFQIEIESAAGQLWAAKYAATRSAVGQ